MVVRLSKVEQVYVSDENGNTITGGALADAIAETNRILQDNRAFLHVFNGTTWDRVRSASPTLNPSAGVLPASLTLTDAAGFRRWFTANAEADGSAGNTFPDVGLRIFNGLNYDRVRSIETIQGSAVGKGVLGIVPVLWDGSQYRRMLGSDANGLDVDVTRSVLPAGAATETGLGTDGGTAPDSGTGIRGWLRSLLDWWKARLDAAGRIPVTTHESGSIDIGAGRIFTSGGQVTLSSSQVGVIMFTNPVTTPTKKMTIIGFSCYVNTTDSLRIEFVKDPTRTGGDQRDPVNHNFASAETAVAQIHTGVGIISLGTVLHPTARTTRDNHFSYQGAPFAGITPGTSLAMRVTAPSGLGTTVLADFTVVWKEEDL